MTRPDEQYIGDGVYASFDGFNIWLRTQSGNEIGLEPEVLYALDLYRRLIDRRYKVERYSPVIEHSASPTDPPTQSKEAS